MSEPLEVTIDIDAPPEVVFPYLTDPDRYAEWMGTSATLDPSPGGTYRVEVGEGMAAGGSFVEVDPPHRAVFTWGWEGDPIVAPGSTRVEITLEPTATGTHVRLVHHGLPEGEATDQHRAGWELYLPRLATAVGGGDPGPDPNATS